MLDFITTDWIWGFGSGIALTSYLFITMHLVWKKPRNVSVNELKRRQNRHKKAIYKGMDNYTKRIQH